MTVHDAENFEGWARGVTSDAPANIELTMLRNGTSRSYATSGTTEMVRAIRSFLDEFAVTGGWLHKTEVRIRLDDYEWDVVIVGDGDDPDTPLVHFRDGSIIDLVQFDSSGPGRDLYGRIGHAEYANIERLVAVLIDAAAVGALTERQQLKILAIARLIETTRNETTPEATERWRLVGAVRASLSYLRKDLPRDALAWTKLREILEENGWLDWMDGIF